MVERRSDGGGCCWGGENLGRGGLAVWQKACCLCRGHHRLLYCCLFHGLCSCLVLRRHLLGLRSDRRCSWVEGTWSVGDLLICLCRNFGGCLLRLDFGLEGRRCPYRGLCTHLSHDLCCGNHGPVCWKGSFAGRGNQDDDHVLNRSCLRYFRCKYEDRVGDDTSAEVGERGKRKWERRWVDLVMGGKRKGQG